MERKLLTIDVSHGTTHDGPGMRTTVFVKGCPLHCLWCQNPESIARRNEVWWEGVNCIGSGSCFKACPNQALHADGKGIHVNRAKCEACGTCTDACPSTAMSWQGQEYDMELLLKEVLKDRAYYKQFGGGVTCSGGEPLLQYEFVTELFRRVKEEGVTTALDTCGCVPQENLETVLPYTDYILYDMKLWDPKEHQKFTGAPNQQILKNLLYAAEYIRKERKRERSMEIWIRTPLIPGATAKVANIADIGTFIRDNILDVTARWELCAFNGVCSTKYERLETTWAYQGVETMTQEEISPLKEAALKLVPEEKLLVSGMIK